MSSPVRASRAALVDTHCHVDLFPDPAALVRQIERQRVYTIAVTNAPNVFPRLCEIVGDARFVRAALGLHPELAVQRHSELPQFAMLLPRTRYVGEVGLDYQTTVESERAIQRRVLSTIIEHCDTSGDKVVTVHSRRAADDVVDAFGERFRGTYILHWYSGGVKALRRAVANGAFFSFNTAMMRSERGRAAALEIPRERVLTETDGPFVLVENAPAEPDRVRLVIDGLAGLWNTSRDEAQCIVYDNFASLLQGSAIADDANRQP
jgi:TatD DNase family protein